MLGRELRFASVLVCALVSACGGDAFVSDNGSGGSGANAGSGANGGSGASGGTAGGANGGAGNAAGTASGGTSGSGGNPSGGSSNGGTGGSRECPDTRPSGSCDVPGLECSYGDPSCCTDTLKCEDGVWITYPCPQVSCPLAAPAHGSDCTCLEGRQCPYDCSGGVVSTEASCTNAGTWSVQTRPCPGPCGSQTCMLGQVCVTKIKGSTLDSQYCTQTACTGQLTCQCGGALCGVGFSCTDVQDLGLICTANTSG